MCVKLWVFLSIVQSYSHILGVTLRNKVFSCHLFLLFLQRVLDGIKLIPVEDSSLPVDLVVYLFGFLKQLPFWRSGISPDLFVNEVHTLVRVAL